MIERLAAGAVTAAVAVALAGCSAPAPPPPASVAGPATTAAAPPAAPAPALPPPEALTEVIYRLADPALPGTEKIPLVEGATAADAATLDRFATALRDGGFDPVSVGATDIAWVDTQPADAQPAAVVATIEVAPGGVKPEGVKPGGAASAEGGDGEAFRFPMEFRPEGGGWQLTRDTAEMLLDFPAPGPTPTP